MQQLMDSSSVVSIIVYVFKDDIYLEALESINWYIQVQNFCIFVANNAVIVYAVLFTDIRDRQDSAL